MSSKILFITDHPEYPQIGPQLLALSGMEISVQDQNLVSDDCRATTLACHDLILIHLDSKESNSAAICRQLRPKYDRPILVLMHENDERCLLHNYAAGADDCLVQPRDNSLLVAKIQTWLRRSTLACGLG
jgi:DNA-binding response OmpR family regulator